MKLNSTLSGLVLHNSLVKRSGLRSLATALKVNASLETLGIGNTMLSEDAYADFKQSMSFNAVLEEILSGYLGHIGDRSQYDRLQMFMDNPKRQKIRE